MIKNNNFSNKEINEIIREYREEHKIIGTDKPVILSELSAIAILSSRKRMKEYLNSVHPSHDMTKWRDEIMSPVGTPRFYNYRECKKCGGEQYYHSAGKFIDRILEEKCLD